MQSHTRVVVFVLSTVAFILGLLFTSKNAHGQEKITLSAPETKPSNTGYVVERVLLDVKGGAIFLNLRGDNGELVSCAYSARTVPTGNTLIVVLNKANLSSAYSGNATTGSLAQRIFHRLAVMNESATVCDKPLVGTLTGSPK